MTSSERKFYKYAKQINPFLESTGTYIYKAEGIFKHSGFWSVDDDDDFVIGIGRTFIENYWKNALVILLHETGHLLTYLEDMYDLNVRMNECWAWVIAEMLLEDLKWPIDRKYFVRIRRESLKSYNIGR